CADVRVYVLDVAHFNASMAPNGALTLWTGALLRAENEAQLAYVLGHEVAHFRRRHTLSRWRDLRAKTSALAFVQIAAAGAGVGYVGTAAHLIAQLSALAYSREQEEEADEIGLRMVASAGYDPREAARVWTNLEQEEAASDHDRPAAFLSTHPSGPDRAATLAELAKQADPTRALREQGREVFLATTLPHRSAMLRGELRKRSYETTEVLLERLAADGAGPGRLHYFRGELYRLRAKPGDDERALSAYAQSSAHADAPPALHRSRGLVLMKLARKSQARAALTKYLQLHPHATDQRMIRSYIDDLQ
ncbi:MAG: M48 family metalloprotease, partial [Gammaproteobacteria bacterium]